MNRTLKRIVAPVGAALIIGTSGFAFMASNSVPVTRAGEGSNGIVGYEVSNVRYQMLAVGAAGGQVIGGVSFDLNAPARTNGEAVIAFVNGPGGTPQAEFRRCNSSNGGISWFCDSVDNQRIKVSDATTLTVAAVQ